MMYMMQSKMVVVFFLPSRLSRRGETLSQKGNTMVTLTSLEGLYYQFRTRNEAVDNTFLETLVITIVALLLIA
jgi:hypothetical protein